MPEFKINVTTEVTVKISEGHWITDAEDRKDWAKTFYDFDTIEDHAEHIAQLVARGLATNETYVEGYGELEKHKIITEIGDTETEIQERL